MFPLSHTWSPTAQAVVLDIRLPRLLGALLVGGALASSGATYQNVFRNPLVSPDILGVSAGASFGAALAITLGGSLWAIEVVAFAGGVAAAAASFVIARVFAGRSPIVLVLGGVVIAAIAIPAFVVLFLRVRPTRGRPRGRSRRSARRLCLRSGWNPRVDAPHQAGGAFGSVVRAHSCSGWGAGS